MSTCPSTPTNRSRSTASGWRSPVRRQAQAICDDHCGCPEPSSPTSRPIAWTVGDDASCRGGLDALATAAPPLELLDHLVGLQQQRFGNRQPEGLRRLEIDDELEPRGLFERQLAGLGAPQNLVD